jgi:glutathione synthase
MNVNFIIDPIEQLKIKKDSSVVMMEAAIQKGWRVHYCTINDLFVIDGKAYVTASELTIDKHQSPWYRIHTTKTQPLADFDIHFMRKDPPFDMEYIYVTYILELAEKQGALIINRPQALRDANEKMYITHFPEHTPPTLITRSKNDLKKFLDKHQDLILKPLDGMGGSSIFRLQTNDSNFNVVYETLSQNGQCFIMVQKYQPEIEKGDKRIIIIDGVPLDYCLARLPADNEIRANLATGGSGRVQKITPKEKQIAQIIGDKVIDQGIIFAGIDLIGECITEINVTSPTCLKEIQTATSIDAGDLIMKAAYRHYHRQ